MSWNTLTKAKRQLPDDLEPFLIKFNGMNNKVKYQRCDNATKPTFEVYALTKYPTGIYSTIHHST
jgi:hypothetical protein